MASWLIPALKAILPHVGTIISATTPVFTKKRAENAALLQQQIDELQAAASANAAHIRDLAEQLQGTVAALEQAAALAESRLRLIILVCAAAGVVSTGALAVALYALIAR